MELVIVRKVREKLPIEAWVVWTTAVISFFDTGHSKEVNEWRGPDCYRIALGGCMGPYSQLELGGEREGEGEGHVVVVMLRWFMKYRMVWVCLYSQVSMP